MQTVNNEQMEKITDTMLQNCTEMNGMMRDTVNATLQSVSIMTQGCSDLCNSLSSLMQKSLEQSLKISKTMMSASSPTELMDAQNGVIKNSFDSLVSEMNNISQLSSRIAQQAAEPVTKQLNETMSKISKVKAA